MLIRVPACFAPVPVIAVRRSPPHQRRGSRGYLCRYALGSVPSFLHADAHIRGTGAAAGRDQQWECQRCREAAGRWRYAREVVFFNSCKCSHTATHLPFVHDMHIVLLYFGNRGSCRWPLPMRTACTFPARPTRCVFLFFLFFSSSAHVREFFKEAPSITAKRHRASLYPTHQEADISACRK